MMRRLDADERRGLDTAHEVLAVAKAKADPGSGEWARLQLAVDVLNDLFGTTDDYPEAAPAAELRIDVETRERLSWAVEEAARALGDEVKGSAMFAFKRADGQGVVLHVFELTEAVGAKEEDK